MKEQNTKIPNQSTIESFNEIKQGKYTNVSLVDFKKSLRVLPKNHKAFNKETIAAIKRSKSSKNLITHESLDSMFKGWDDSVDLEHAKRVSKEIEEGKIELISWEEIKEKLNLKK